MKEFVVTRHAYNSANNPSRQGGPSAVPVARVKAETEEEACQLARRRVTVYPNQQLSAEDAEEWDRRNQEIEERVKLIDEYM